MVMDTPYREGNAQNENTDCLLAASISRYSVPYVPNLDIVLHGATLVVRSSITGKTCEPYAADCRTVTTRPQECKIKPGHITPRQKRAYEPALMSNSYEPQAFSARRSCPIPNK